MEKLPSVSQKVCSIARAVDDNERCAIHHRVSGSTVDGDIDGYEMLVRYEGHK